MRSGKLVHQARLENTPREEGATGMQGNLDGGGSEVWEKRILGVLGFVDLEGGVSTLVWPRVQPTQTQLLSERLILKKQYEI